MSRGRRLRWLLLDAGKLFELRFMRRWIRVVLVFFDTLILFFFFGMSLACGGFLEYWVWGSVMNKHYGNESLMGKFR